MDRYLFWIGEAQFALGHFTESAETYGVLIENYPESSRALEASLGRAQSFYQLSELKKLIETLEPADGPFQKSVNATPALNLVIDGRLLLANAYFELKELGAARLLLENLSDVSLSSERFWQKYHLLASVYLAEASLDRALEGAKNLVQFAKGITDPVFAARSIDFHGDVLTRMEKADEAISIYEQNLATNVPVDWRRAALLKISDVYLNEDRLSNAIHRLERFFIKHPNDPANGLSHMTLGELRLRKFYSIPESSRPNNTNLLSQAQQQKGQIDQRTRQANMQLGAREAQMQTQASQFNIAQNQRAQEYMRNLALMQNQEEFANKFGALQAMGQGVAGSLGDVMKYKSDQKVAKTNVANTLDKEGKDALERANIAAIEKRREMQEELSDATAKARQAKQDQKESDKAAKKNKKALDKAKKAGYDTVEEFEAAQAEAAAQKTAAKQALKDARKSRHGGYTRRRGGIRRIKR